MAKDPTGTAAHPEGDDSLGAHVDAWLEKDGAALELRTERALARAGYRTRHSTYYDDPGTGKAREIDVVASRTGWTMLGGHSLTLVVECKSSAEHPWVLFRSRQDPTQGFVDLMVTRGVDGLGDRARPVRPSRTVAFDCPLLAPFGTTTVYAAKAVGIKANVAHQALEQVLSAASAVANLAQADLSGRQESSFVVVIPIVVTAAPLFVVSLGPDGAFHRERVSRALMLHQGGTSDSSPPNAVWLWDAAALDDLSDAAAATGNGMAVD